jgi:hypothetical protein
LDRPRSLLLLLLIAVVLNLAAVASAAADKARMLQLLRRWTAVMAVAATATAQLLHAPRIHMARIVSCAAMHSPLLTALLAAPSVAAHVAGEPAGDAATVHYTAAIHQCTAAVNQLDCAHVHVYFSCTLRLLR